MQILSVKFLDNIKHGKIYTYKFTISGDHYPGDYEVDDSSFEEVKDG